MPPAPKTLSHGACLLTMAVMLAGCVKSAEEEQSTEIIDGTANQVRILAGVAASPHGLAQAYCDQYQKSAYLRDAEPEGTVFEQYAEGSRNYVYTFDCL